MTTDTIIFCLIILMFGFRPIVKSSNRVAITESDSVSSSIEVFTFTSNGEQMNGKIYLPPAYSFEKNLPVIYLIDFTEQHFKLAEDEFEKVIQAVEGLEGLKALVVSLEEIHDFDAEPDTYQEHFEIYQSMAFFVGEKYTNNPSRTFIGKGSESGVVLMSLFLENSENSLFNNFIVTDPSPKYASAIIKLIEAGDFPEHKANKKLHYSFSSSNNRALCTELINLIKDANFGWLELESIEYRDSNYENTYPISYAEGIQYVFQK